MAAVLQRDSLSALLLDDDMDLWLEEPEPMVEPSTVDVLASLIADDDGDNVIDPRCRGANDGLFLDDSDETEGSTTSGGIDEEADLAERMQDEQAWKRRKHREAMQRCRMRKRNRMGTLEKQEKQLLLILQQRMRDLELVRKKRFPRESNRMLLAASEDVLMSSSNLLGDFQRLSLSQRRRTLADMVYIRQNLLRERRALETALCDHQKFNKILAQAAAEMSPAVSDPFEPSPSANPALQPDPLGSCPAGSGHPVDGGHWVQYLEDEPPFFYVPEPLEVIDAHVRDCFQRVRRLQAGFTLKQFVPVTEAHCLGWCAQRSLALNEQNQSIVRVRFTKRIPRSRATLDEIQHASWRVLSCEKQNARLYSSRVVAKIVQRVNADTYIFARNSPNKDGHLNVRYFSLHSQMEYRTEANERATVTLMLLLDKEPLMVDDAPDHKGPPVIWLKEGTLFLNFTEKARLPHESEDAIEIEYGGSIRCLSEEHAQYLMVEIGGILMRWEHLVIPPRLLKLD
ncbi:hypothetical protein P43SY_000112 [Pythium insidiosum]|uniref:Uncharacterized protein n=1 Tax=Pythium insidiosum TaxID=114742 RepID=A0AAD5LH00_PYTIN|nr:hypothetical protein P43SY_000112 [Pythium insidiosum]